MTEKKSMDALEGFVTLMSSAKGDQCVMVLKQALKDPRIFVFGELVDHPNAAALAEDPKTAPWLELLKIFAYGTFRDYTAKKASLPKISEAEAQKLKMLTIVSQASVNKELSYASIMEAVDISMVRMLEDLIIETVYLGLLNGQLDQKRGLLLVQSSIARDIGPADVAEMRKNLTIWLTASEDLVKTLSSHVEQADTTREKERKNEAERSKKIDSIRESIRATREVELTSSGGLAGLGGRVMQGMGMGSVAGRAGKRRKHGGSGNVYSANK
eukprot:gb/GEZN01012463.1/.p1 GENE.gb/GEZN01012463.1/~~gb/GEZN01012463.1/.p1  ORF type:complete len:271 (+),score=43.23 gb/GEZN01012463.1/:74-886(+)